MSEKEGAKIAFSSHAIAYLDILGFSRFVEEAENPENVKLWRGIWL